MWSDSNDSADEELTYLQTGCADACPEIPTYPNTLVTKHAKRGFARCLGSKRVGERDP